MDCPSNLEKIYKLNSKKKKKKKEEEAWNQNAYILDIIKELSCHQQLFSIF